MLRIQDGTDEEADTSSEARAIPGLSEKWLARAVARILYELHRKTRSDGRFIAHERFYAKRRSRVK